MLGQFFRRFGVAGVDAAKHVHHGFAFTRFACLRCLPFASLLCDLFGRAFPFLVGLVVDAACFELVGICCIGHFREIAQRHDVDLASVLERKTPILPQVHFGIELAGRKEAARQQYGRSPCRCYTRGDAALALNIHLQTP